jgi:hypothetical protein
VRILYVSIFKSEPNKWVLTVISVAPLQKKKLAQPYPDLQPKGGRTFKEFRSEEIKPFTKLL